MTSTITAVSVRPFDESSPRYHCCCGCIHVRTGAFLIGCLQAMGLFSLLFRSAKVAGSFRPDVDYGPSAYAPTALSTLFFVFSIVAVVCLFYGVCNEKPSYLTPMLTLILFAIIYYAFLIIFIAVVFAAGSETLSEYVKIQLEMDPRGRGTGVSVQDPEALVKNKDENVRRTVKAAMLALIVVFLVGIAFDIWWYKVIKACRTYLEEKRAWYAHHPSAHYGFNDRSVAVLLHDDGSGGFGPTPYQGQGHGQYSAAYHDFKDHGNDHNHFNVPPPSYTEALGSATTPAGKQPGQATFQEPN